MLEPYGFACRRWRIYLVLRPILLFHRNATDLFLPGVREHASCYELPTMVESQPAGILLMQVQLRV